MSWGEIFSRKYIPQIIMNIFFVISFVLMIYGLVNATEFQKNAKNIKPEDGEDHATYNARINKMVESELTLCWIGIAIGGITIVVSIIYLFIYRKNNTKSLESSDIISSTDGSESSI
jgi:mannose/fructose/N-acetylgalactosamine-specific phosphotransferase system component IIC